MDRLTGGWVNWQTDGKGRKRGKEEGGKGKSKDERQSRAGRAMPRTSHAIPHAHYGKNQICNEQEALRDGAISEMSE